MERRQFAPVLIGVLITLAAVAAYTACYLGLCRIAGISNGGTQIGIVRAYKVPAAEILFWPAAVIEARATGQEIRLVAAFP